MKLTKHAQVLTDLKNLMKKEAENAATGVPGADTNYTSVSDSTEKVNKNEKGHPEKNPQDVSQKPSTDSSDPTKAGKPVELLEAEKKGAELFDEVYTQEKTATALGHELLAAIQKIAQSATGVPGADTNYTSVSDSTEKVNKNEKGHPEKNPQDVSQKPSTDSSDPTKAGKQANVSQEDIDKLASFEWGRSVAFELLKQAADQELTVYKEAGRRDFETLIAQAAQELEEQTQYEKIGSDLFDAVITQEQQAYQANVANRVTKTASAASYKTEVDTKMKELNDKLASLEALKTQLEKAAADAIVLQKQAEATLKEKSEQEKRAAEISYMIEAVTHNVLKGLESESK